MIFSWSLGQGCPGLRAGCCWINLRALCSPSAPIHNPQSFPPSPSCTVQSQPPHPALRIFLLPNPQPSSLKVLDTEPTKALLTGFITSTHAALCPPTPPNSPPGSQFHDWATPVCSKILPVWSRSSVSLLLLPTGSGTALQASLIGSIIHCGPLVPAFCSFPEAFNTPN